ncbi:hypothetical protein RND81_08G125100 [Saponaria officinalis]|uniref:Bifunctional inhibitor/plant lipid transfer protein/seed storage helical domain-containing protein n=1 Tax=Saponaria officinalis TaxID=3572 RepID=A0AAW1J5X6_SAPOF
MSKMSVKVILILVLGIMWASISVKPTSAQSDGLCWNKIGKCMLDQMGRLFDEPTTKPGPTSPSFNMTQTLCCPLIEQAAQNDRECFCVMDTLAHKDPKQVSNIINLLSLCNIVDSVASLDNFCLDIAPTAAEAPTIPIVEGPILSAMPPL